MEKHKTMGLGDSMKMNSTGVRARPRPAFEKLAIGPLMVFGEMITGGHYLEVLRLGKQMTVGKERSPSYWNLHAGLVNESGTFIGAFYRGFLPWGLIQCVKGVPVLFVQHETMYQLRSKLDMSAGKSEKLSGFAGGAAQALFVCPFQKIKVNVVACERMNAMYPLDAMKNIIKRNGLISLYDGVLPMVLRRSLDWGIRFSVSSEVKAYVVNHKRNTGQSSKLSLYELIGCGLIGGAFSALTHPIDNTITNSQKPLPTGVPRDMMSVMKRMYQESGTKAFTRGWGIKVIDNSYHMAWMYGIGTVAYDYLGNALKGY